MKLTIDPLALPEIKLISAPRFGDLRGHFAETYVRRDFVAGSTPSIDSNACGAADPGGRQDRPAGTLPRGGTPAGGA
jgi:hypothetical protein